MQKIVSYSIFGHPASGYWRPDATPDKFSAYARFLPALVRGRHALWSGWELRIHHDDRVRAHPYWRAMERMHEEGVLRLVDCGTSRFLCASMMWRMRPVFEESDAYVCCYDVDAAAMVSMRQAVEEFMASGKAVHLVHSAPSHDGFLGGTTTVHAAEFRRLTGAGTWDDLLAMAPSGWDWNIYASDENFLRHTVWPMVSSSGMIHRLCGGDTAMPCDDIRRELAMPAPDDIPAVVVSSGAFADYIGASDYNIGYAIQFYGGLPLPVMGRIAACEAP